MTDYDDITACPPNCPCWGEDLEDEVPEGDDPSEGPDGIEHTPDTACFQECVHDYDDCANMAPEDRPHTDEDHDNLGVTT